MRLFCLRWVRRHIRFESTYLNIPLLRLFVIVGMCGLLQQDLFAQLLPQGAHVNLFFPQLADGGSSASRWQTRFVFVNPDTSSSASLDLYIYDNNGSPLALDFGFGASSTHRLTIPAGGSRMLQSRASSSQMRVGWASAYASQPIQGTVYYREFVNGNPKQEIAAQSTLPTNRFLSPASRYHGIALANVYTQTSVVVDLQYLSSEGQPVGSPFQVSLPPLGHTAFILNEKISNIGDGYGTVSIVSHTPPNDEFIAWTLGGDSAGVWSSLPPGSFAWPVSHWDRIWLVYMQVAKVAKQMAGIDPIPQLRILYDRQINARADSGQRIDIYVALSQLVSDSPSELAFVIGHELGHIYQQRNSGRMTFNLNAESDADVWGVLFSLVAGYDPYAAGGVLGKLSMASGQAGLITQFGLELYDVHRSFNTRLETIFTSFSQACNSDPTVKSYCDLYKSIIHPNFPANAPLDIERPKR